jgi:glycosyl transferase family WbsX
MKLIPFYFPQFYRTPENDAWWGEGFTDWDLVKSARPHFVGQRLPRQPLDGYYCQSEPEVLRRQVALAKRHGISAFNFYHYWFDGVACLDAPVQNFLRDPAIQGFEFCLTWANESWTRQWRGRPNDYLIRQRHNPSPKLWGRHFDYLRPLFEDARYLKVDGRPVFIVYRAELIRRLPAFLAFMRAQAEQAGFPGLYLIAGRAYPMLNAKRLYAGFDAVMDFEPRFSINSHLRRLPEWRMQVESLLRHLPEWTQRRLQQLSGPRGGGRFNYEDYLRTLEQRAPVLDGKPAFPTVFPDWDNGARYAERATFFAGAAPQQFARALALAASSLRALSRADRGAPEFLFINAWNEWSEAAYLEPDTEFGYAFLETVRDFLSQPARPGEAGDPVELRAALRRA